MISNESFDFSSHHSYLALKECGSNYELVFVCPPIGGRSGLIAITESNGGTEKITESIVQKIKLLNTKMAAIHISQIASTMADGDDIDKKPPLRYSIEHISECKR